jgi:hypothetical protein
MTVGMTMAVGVPVVVTMVVGMGHPNMLYYNITGVHALAPDTKPTAGLICG